MKLRGVVLWRWLALALWIISVACLFKAIGDGVTAEESLNNPYLTSHDRTDIQHLSTISEHWSLAGWGIQAVVAVVLSGGIRSERMTRRIFASLGVLIAADGILLLLVAVIIH